jgi:hypothetical protein
MPHQYPEEDQTKAIAQYPEGRHSIYIGEGGDAERTTCGIPVRPRNKSEGANRVFEVIAARSTTAVHRE